MKTLSASAVLLATLLSGCGYTEQEMQLQRDRVVFLQERLELCVETLPDVDGGQQ